MHIKGVGRVSWYKEHQLTLIESGKLELLANWEEEEKLDDEKKSDLDWIFANGNNVLDKGYGASISSLADCLGITDLWGGTGEGVVYFSNARAVLNMATPFILSGDKEGWLKHCDEFKQNI